ncbi:probable leucine-rich repeat receptor-like serine/threonine-protein kinase At3g14840 isoform X3 [Rosa rugosa]|uniref:probable leucine-rich repeat receptor-like serine/threonine-protein kinase At3g14840 isoform X3 n=1 Tax=Rosa rugosa TaxID=74645 RepID=UPI002B413284|nr:probable leucine-rich repeat receptor-like serine/threonine-protein kinase At3g14840 isoform X3 [Rosa rugosa]
MGTEASARLVSFILISLMFTLCQLGSEFKYQSIARKLPDEEVGALNQITEKLYLYDGSFCNESIHDGIIRCNCSFQDGTICHVTEIALGAKSLSGGIPEELGNLTHLRELDLSNNQLTGSIPASFGKLSSLYKLDLSINQLTGSIPASLGNLSLGILDLSYNQLSGPVPATLRNVQPVASDPDAYRLEGDGGYFYLFLSHNQLTGPIPESLGNLTFISYIVLANNYLNGSIPASLGALTHLNGLSLRNNGISGTLPQALGNLTTLRYFGVASNSINGTLPKSFASLTSLYSFSISGNYLSGPLPDFIANWTSIDYLFLNGNNFNGKIPAGIFNLSYLEILSISDVKADSHFQFPPSIHVAESFSVLILRNCSITGHIPSYIGDMSSLKNIDLSFNRLTGRIPDSLKNLNVTHMSFSNNMLSGEIPDWIQNGSIWSKMDFSYNNFSKLNFKPSPNLKLNLFSCCCNSSTCLPNTEYPTKEKYCPRGKHDYHSLFINCGGEETHDAVGNVYDQDNDTSLFYLSQKKNWARSSVGNAYDYASNGNSSKLLKSVRCGLSSEARLYDNARTSLVSLTYYGFCLHKGKYNVTLLFAEIVDEVTDIHEDIDFRSTGKRVFDVYIQGERKLKDFNIIDKAGRTNKEYMINFTAVDVNDGKLEIHFYSRSAGVGTLDGPLISAISVTPEYKQQLSPLQTALITVASIIVFLLLLLLFAWMMGWLGNTDHLQEIDIGIEKPVTLKQLKDATRNFSKRNEIGQGGFGTVYKAEVQGKIVAVKKLCSHSEERINEFINEFYTLKSMSQENLVQLLDIYNAKGLHLLVYEYMENNSLAHALFDSKSRLKLGWEVRFNICLGIARGLMYLHEHPRMKIVHSDIKSANILLDGNLKAKISDFGLARLHTKDDELKFIKVEVPQGYMAPEYVRGIATSKADVYSFGVVILETVSGRTNAGHRRDSQESEFLLDTAYDLHRKGRLVDLVDKTLSTKYDAKQAIIILNLAVKCTSISPTLRPTMSEVVSVLVGDKKIEEICPPALNDSHLARADSSISMEATSRASTSSYLIKGEDETEHISESTPLRRPNETWIHLGFNSVLPLKVDNPK